ncbi:pyruvate dehydrogenase E2 component (dihydrolipoamide acetyltransferase) [Actinomadura luteofluorescens]|uniref:Dihydrolipoamide acetyltransferase component of pyruvate dehydrogenase complex n=1 Tax=Actinomadura luteofluorescens TaxID=46163 RepID=A0A7Y9ENQ0_9ACTN|nr:dihydrolipoamide acetyltransferase family protein [Actinomadura luteofluorescens]NYD51138.1 pyruvate dehydrogenase E2 component (dihydrolipoamide acetyltransferase) [Actinomadura luteofluorescens]
MTAATRQVFRLPDLGEGLTEAEIVEWKVAAGDTVEVDQVVVEVETAKAAVEVPVPYAGTVLRLHAEAGAVLAVGEPLIEVGPAESAAAPDVRPVPDAHPDAARYREEEQAGSGNVLIGYGTGHGPGRRGRRRAGGPKAPAAAPAPVAAAPVAPAPEPRRAGAPRVISPLVRRIAREHGLDLAAVAATGPRGVILRRDVEQAIATTGTPAETPAETPVPAARPMPERIPLRGIRRAVADKLTRSRSEIPDATTWVDADATALVEAKDALRRTRPELGVGLLALLARVCVAALREFPELNSSVDADRQEIVRYGHVNLGFAAQTDRGLVVPVVRDAHLMTTAQIAAELARLTGLARSGGLPPEALTGGTFTLNNYGVFGVDGSTPIINHPEAALLGVGRVIDRPWVVDGAVVPRKMTQLSLTFDHRVCDGGAAGGFLRFVADCVENPAVLLTNL